MDTKNILGYVVGLSLILSVIGLFTPGIPTKELVSDPSIGGAPGNLLAENYDPYIMYNGGFNTAKDFSVSGATALSGAVSLTSTFTLGAAGDAINQANAGICYIRPYAATIAASSTVAVDCQATMNWDAVTGDTLGALAGISDGDFVVASLSTTTAGTTFNGLQLAGASASSTAGIITLHVTNLTGNTYTWPTTSGVASGTASYWSTDK